MQSFHTDYTYDLAGRVTEILYPARHYDVYGWQDSAIRYEYDGEFLEQVCDLGGGSDCDSAGLNFVTSTAFDSLGRLSSITSPAGVRNFEYALDTHRLSKDEYTSSSYQYTRDYTDYDGVGNITSISGSESASPALDMSETYVYDERNRIESWTKDGTQFDYGYDDLGNLTMHAGQIQVYDDPDRPSAITRRDLAATTPTTYSYDDDGNVVSIAGTESSQFFAFDSANQIVCTSDTSSNCQTRVAYDVAGKRIASYGKGGRTFDAYIGDTFRYDNDFVVDHASIEVMLDGKRIALKRFRPQLRSATLNIVGLTPPPAWLIASGLSTFGLALVIVLYRRTASQPAVIAWPNHREPRNRRSRRLRAATALTTTSLLLLPTFAFAAVPANASAPTYFWEVADSLGTGLVLLNENGERVRHQVFTPFGAVHEEVGVNLRTYFGGHQRDESSGMFYMQARWYDPGVRRIPFSRPADPVRDGPPIHERLLLRKKQSPEQNRSRWNVLASRYQLRHPGNDIRRLPNQYGTRHHQIRRRTNRRILHILNSQHSRRIERRRERNRRPFIGRVFGYREWIDN